MIAKIIIGAFGTLALVVGLLVLVGRIRLYTRGVRATGEVVSGLTHAQVRPDGPPLYARKPVVAVVDRSTGKRFTFQSSFASSLTRIRIGEKVPVRYVPGDPDLAEIDRLAPMWFFPVGVLGFSGLLFWVLGRI